jgi:hypothetical protein
MRTSLVRRVTAEKCKNVILTRSVLLIVRCCLGCDFLFSDRTGQQNLSTSVRRLGRFDVISLVFLFLNRPTRGSTCPRSRFENGRTAQPEPRFDPPEPLGSTARTHFPPKLLTQPSCKKNRRPTVTHLNSNVTLRLLRSRLQGYFNLLIPTYKNGAQNNLLGYRAVGCWAVGRKSSRWPHQGFFFPM